MILEIGDDKANKTIADIQENKRDEEELDSWSNRLRTKDITLEKLDSCKLVSFVIFFSPPI